MPTGWVLSEAVAGAGGGELFADVFVLSVVLVAAGALVVSSGAWLCATGGVGVVAAGVTAGVGGAGLTLFVAAVALLLRVIVTAGVGLILTVFVSGVTGCGGGGVGVGAEFAAPARASFVEGVGFLIATWSPPLTGGSC